MVVNFEIIIVYKQDAAKAGKNYRKIVNKVLTPMTDVQIYKTTMAKLSEANIISKLHLACNEIENEVILIIGNIGFVEKSLISKTIKSFNENNKNDYSEYRIPLLILNMDTRLKDISPHQISTICGILNKKLIIDLSGPHKNMKDCLRAVTNLILQTVYTIRKPKDINVPAHDVASGSGIKSTKEEKTVVVLKRRKMSLPPPVPPKPIKRPKELFPMVSLSEALIKVRDITNQHSRDVDYVMVQLNEAYGRILGKSVRAVYNIPPFNTSTKHGYAVLASDGTGLRKVLNVENTSPSISLESGTCVWVKSGAPIPDGATAVVPEEDTKTLGKFEDSDDMYIEIMIEPENEQNIKPIGYDLVKGEIVVSSFERIGPREVALIAASGHKEVLVVKNISIGVLSIGNNLEKLEKPLRPGYVHDINRLILIALLKEKKFHALDFGIVKDELSPIQNKTMDAFREVDLLVTTGSTNDKGLLKKVLENYYKADIQFGNVNVKPGKSTILATCIIEGARKFILCLPRNSGSAFIGAHIFLLPLVNELCCNFQSETIVVPTRLASQYVLHSRSRLAWTLLDWTDKKEYPLAYQRGNAISDTLASAVGANALLFLPKKGTTLEKFKSWILAILIKLPRKFNNRNFCEVLPPRRTHRRFAYEM